MAPKNVSDDDFISCWVRYASPSKVAKAFNKSDRWAYTTRTRIEQERGFLLPSVPEDARGEHREPIPIPKVGHRHVINGFTGTCVVFSDAHFWPGDRSPAFEALLKLIPVLRPKFIVCNGDAFDGARVSRHPPVGWIELPEVADELAACQAALGEIASVADEGIMLAWCMGNHDTRFSARLAQLAPDYVRVHGTDLKDHFPDWSFCWSTFINGHTTIKHRYHNGIHATWNNVLKSGHNMVCGHLHRLMITPFVDYDGIRYGVDTGTLSKFGPDVEKFSWLEDNPIPWTQGFVVLEFDETGDMAPPDLVTVIKNRVRFRGAWI